MQVAFELVAPRGGWNEAKTTPQKKSNASSFSPHKSAKLVKSPIDEPPSSPGFAEHDLSPAAIDGCALDMSARFLEVAVAASAGDKDELQSQLEKLGSEVARLQSQLRSEQAERQQLLRVAQKYAVQERVDALQEERKFEFLDLELGRLQVQTADTPRSQDEDEVEHETEAKAVVQAYGLVVEAKQALELELGVRKELHATETQQMRDEHKAELVDMNISYEAELEAACEVQMRAVDATVQHVSYAKQLELELDRATESQRTRDEHNLWLGVHATTLHKAQLVAVEAAHKVQLKAVKADAQRNLDAEVDRARVETARSVAVKLVSQTKTQLEQQVGGILKLNAAETQRMRDEHKEQLIAMEAGIEAADAALQQADTALQQVEQQDIVAEDADYIEELLSAQEAQSELYAAETQQMWDEHQAQLIAMEARLRSAHEVQLRATEALQQAEQNISTEEAQRILYATEIKRMANEHQAQLRDVEATAEAQQHFAPEDIEVLLSAREAERELYATEMQQMRDEHTAQLIAAQSGFEAADKALKAAEVLQKMEQAQQNIAAQQAGQDLEGLKTFCIQTLQTVKSDREMERELYAAEMLRMRDEHQAQLIDADTALQQADTALQQAEQQDIVAEDIEELLSAQEAQSELYAAEMQRMRDEHQAQLIAMEAGIEAADAALQQAHQEDIAAEDIEVLLSAREAEREIYATEMQRMRDELESGIGELEDLEAGLDAAHEMHLQAAETAAQVQCKAPYYYGPSIQPSIQLSI
jgi:hypothetical protein